MKEKKRKQENKSKEGGYMRNSPIIVALVIVACLITLSPRDANAFIGLRLSGSYGYVNYKDFNEFAKYMNGTVFKDPTVRILAEMPEIHWMPETKLEFVFSLRQGLSSGIGVGYLRGSSEFNTVIRGGTIDQQDLGYNHTIDSYPLTYTVYFSLPTTTVSWAVPMIYFGLGAYYTKASFDLTDVTATEDNSMTSELTDWGWGMHGGAGVEFELTPVITLDIEFFGRFAENKGVTGTMKDASGSEEDAYLMSDLVDDKFIQGPNLYYGPWETDDRQYDEGTVTLTGFGFTFGIKVAW